MSEGKKTGEITCPKAKRQTPENSTTESTLHVSYVCTVPFWHIQGKQCNSISRTCDGRAINRLFVNAITGPTILIVPNSETKK